MTGRRAGRLGCNTSVLIVGVLIVGNTQRPGAGYLGVVLKNRSLAKKLPRAQIACSANIISSHLGGLKIEYQRYRCSDAELPG